MTKMISATNLLTAVAIAALSLSSAAQARRGADDAVTHVRGGHGADDAVGHVRQSRGADDAVAEVRQSRGADDAATDDRGGAARRTDDAPGKVHGGRHGADD